MRYLNERIRQLRKQLGYTQQKFADSLNISRNTVATYENGNSEPSEAAINNICRVFSVNKDWLRTGKGNMFIELTRNEKIAAFIGDIQMEEDDDNFKLQLISALCELDHDGWKALEQLANKMYEMNKKEQQ